MATNQPTKVTRKSSEVKEWDLLDYSLKKQPIIAVNNRLNAKGLALDDLNLLVYIPDSSNYCIQVVTFDGNFITSFGEDIFEEPYAIAVTEDHVFVSDQILYTVFQFSDYKLARIDTSGVGEEELNFPCGICIDYNGDLYVADSSNDRVCVYTIELKFMKFFGCEELSSPQDVKITHNSIVVLDFSQNCVHFYSRSGHLINSCVSHGRDDLVFYPTFFCLDPAGFIIIPDYSRHNIKILSPSGQLIHTIGRRGHGRGEFVRPQEIIESMAYYNPHQSYTGLSIRNFPRFGSQRQSRKIGIDSLKDYIEEKKDEIKTHFKVYYDTLKETESMLLGDLDAILDIISKEKEKEEKELKEIIATQQFMEEQLKTSENEMLKKHAFTLEIDIQNLRRKANEFSDLEIEWKHLDLCKIINEVCNISFANATPYSSNREVIMSVAPCVTDRQYWDCCYDKNDNRVYLLATESKHQGPLNTLILTFDDRFRLLSTFDIPQNPGTWSPCITTSQDYLFITAGENCDDCVVRISKSNYTKAFIKYTDVFPRKSAVLRDYLYSTSSGSILYKFRIEDLNRQKDIALTGCKDDGTNIDFSNAVDINLRDSEFYILFYSNTLRAVCSFNDKGALLREIVTNPRRLEYPTYFCIDNDNNIIIADRKIKVFDSYGRSIGSFEDFSGGNVKSISFNSVTNNIILLAKKNDKWLHAY